MKIRCRYSGEEFRVELFDGISIADNIEIERATGAPGFSRRFCHPIFLLSTAELLSRVKDWRKGRFNEREQRLIFLALLNSTRLVDFHVPANPSPRVVGGNIISLIRLASLSEITHSDSVRFPRYAVTEQTSDLSSIRTWITSWYEAKEAYYNPESSSRASYKIEVLERRLNKYLTSIYRNQAAPAGLMLAWVTSTLSLPASKVAKWKKYFIRGSADKALTYSPEEIEELGGIITYLEVELYTSLNSSSHALDISDAVLTLLRKDYTKAKNGLIGELEGQDYFTINSFDFNWDTDDEVIGDIDGNPQPIGAGITTTSKGVTNGSGSQLLNPRPIGSKYLSLIKEQRDQATREAKANATLAAKAPAIEPKLSNYGGRVKEFMHDKAAWIAAQNAKRYTGG